MKKFTFLSRLIAVAILFVLFFAMGTHADCTKDIDCKGDRICEKGICVNPGQAEQSPAVMNANKQNRFEDLLGKIDGRRYTFVTQLGSTLILDVRGKVFVPGTIDYDGKYKRIPPFEIQGRVTTIPDYDGNRAIESLIYTISEDGDRITRRVQMRDGTGSDYIYLRQR